MAHTKEQQFIDELLGDSFVQQVLHELNLQDAPKDVQEKILAALGVNIFKRVMLEILTVLPESARDEFEKFVGNGDMRGMRAFLEQQIPNVEHFVQQHAMNEYEATKTRTQMIRQGVEQ